MLSDTDVLILKLALEREIIDSKHYADVLKGITGGNRKVAQLLRGVGVSGKAVGILVDQATPMGTDDQGAFLARCDVENTVMERGLANAGWVPQERLDKARAEVAEKGRQGTFYGISEILVEQGVIDVLHAAEMRRRVRTMVATCGGCFRNYLVRGRLSDTCPECGERIEAGSGTSAIDAWRPGGSAAAIRPSERFVRTSKGAMPVRDSERFVPSSLSGSDERASVSLVSPSSEQLPELRPGLPGGELDDREHKTTIIADLLASAEAGDSLIMGDAVARFGKYEILTELARGGMGVVYKARKMGEDQEVALKVLIAGPKATAQNIARFEREAEVARKFAHPNIVRVYKYGSHEGYRYLTMEFAEGITLDQAVEEEPMEGARAAKIMAQVADAVHYIHEQGVIHRDLKPENVIIDASDTPKLIDFGLVKVEDSKITKSHTTLGTPSFMSPEQVRGQKVKPPSDVYALGAVLYAVLTGEVPFDGENTMDLFRAIVYEPLVLPTAYNAAVPADLETIVLQAMAKAPADRYPTAAALKEDLERFLSGGKIKGRRPAPPKGEGPSRLLILAALLLIVVAVVFGVLGFLLAKG